MGKATGQMQEETRELLDHYNNLYNWDYNEMCRFIENYGETYFLTYYDIYHRLCEDYGTELVDLFSDYFDVDTVPHFENMYEGQFETAKDFTEYYCTEVDEATKNLPDYVTLDYQDIWDNKLSKEYVEIDCSMVDHTYGHIFKLKY